MAAEDFPDPMRHPGRERIHPLRVVDQRGRGQVARGLVPDFVGAVLPLEPGDGFADVVQAREVGDEPARSVWGHVEFVGDPLADTGCGVVFPERERGGCGVAEVAGERIFAVTTVGVFEAAPFPPGRSLHDRDRTRRTHRLYRFEPYPDRVTVLVSRVPPRVCGDVPLYSR